MHRPRLVSDNDPCYVAKTLGTHLTQHGLTHTRGTPYHPMTQGKIERYHRSMKNVVKLDVYYSPWELERAIARFVAHYNHCRLRESQQNATPADVYEGRQAAILDRRARIKRRTLARRKTGESARRLTMATRRKCDLLKSPNGAEDFDDVQGVSSSPSYRLASSAPHPWESRSPRHPRSGCRT